MKYKWRTLCYYILIKQKGPLHDVWPLSRKVILRRYHYRSDTVAKLSFIFVFSLCYVSEELIFYFLLLIKFITVDNVIFSLNREKMSLQNFTTNFHDKSLYRGKNSFKIIYLDVF